jgi:hypothetical protein
VETITHQVTHGHRKIPYRVGIYSAEFCKMAYRRNIFEINFVLKLCQQTVSVSLNHWDIFEQYFIR